MGSVVETTRRLAADVVRRLEDRGFRGLQAPSPRSSPIFPELAQLWHGVSRESVALVPFLYPHSLVRQIAARKF